MFHHLLIQNYGFAVAKRMLELTPYGYSSVVRVEERMRDILDDTGAVVGSQKYPVFVLSHTGQESTDLKHITELARESNIVSYSVLTKDPDARINRQLPFGELLDERKQIVELLTAAKKRPNGREAKALEKLGLGHLVDDAVLKTVHGKQTVDFEIRHMSIKSEDGKIPDRFRVGGVADGEFAGIAVLSDDGANFLEYGLPGQKLKQTEIAALKSLIDAPIMSPFSLAAKFNDVESQTMKLTKREKGYTSPRQFSISGKGIKDFLASGSGKATLADATLQVDTRAELLTAALINKMEGIGGAGSASLVSELQSAYSSMDYKFYHNFDLAQQEGLNILDSIVDPSKTSKADYRRLADLLKQAHEAHSNDIASGIKPIGVTKHFKDLVKKSAGGVGGISNKTLNGVNLTLDKMEVSVDGVFMVNKKHLESYILGDRDARGNLLRDKAGKTKGRLSNKKSLLASYEGYYMQYLEQGDAMSEAAQQQMRDLRAQIETFVNMGEPIEYTRADGTKAVRFNAVMRDTQSLNARIGVDTPGLPNAFSFLKGRGRIVDDMADDVSIIIPDIMTKGETGFKEFINFDVLDGRKTDAVNPDLQMLLFHRETFTEMSGDTPMVPKVTMDYARGQIAEMEEIFRSGSVPEQVRERMMQDFEKSFQETFNLTFGKHKAGARELNREMIKRINNDIINGNVTDPDVVNMITNYYRRQIFDTAYSGRGANARKVRILKAPDLFRFDIEAEIPSLQGQNEPFLLSRQKATTAGRTLRPGDAAEYIDKGVERTSVAGAGEIVLSRARVYKHRMLSSGLSSVVHQASLGGYDFDDKGLPTIRSYVDNAGNKRTAFMTFRQPTGPSEFVVQSISKDRDTLLELFGENDTFRKTLKEIMEDASADKEMRQSATDMFDYMTMRRDGLDLAGRKRYADLHRKFAGVGLTNEEIRKGDLTGSKDSRLFDESYEFFKKAQIQADSVIEEVYQRVHGQGVQAIPERLMQLMAKNAAGGGTGVGGVLALTPEFMKKAVKELSAEELDYLAPYYLRGQFFRLFGETGAANFDEAERQMMVDGFKKNGIVSDSDAASMLAKNRDGAFRMAEEDFRDRVKLVLQSQLPDSADSAKVAMDKKVALAEFEKAMEIYRTRLNFGDGESSILGSYINKLMSIGSTIDQMEDMTNELYSKGGAYQELAEFLDKNLTAPFIIPEEAVDFTKTTGKMVIKGARDDAARRQQIYKAFTVAAETVGAEDPLAVKKVLADMGITNLDEAGDDLLFNLGRRIGAARAGFEALQIDDIEKLGIDPRLFNIKLSHKNAASKILEGLIEGAKQIAESGMYAAGSDEIERVKAYQSSIESLSGDSVKTIGDAIAVASDSKYATASLHLGAADNFATRLNASSRNAFMMRSASEIDAFYMKRQGAPIATEVQKAAAEIVRNFQPDMKKMEEFQASIRNVDESVGYERALLEKAKIQTGEKVKLEMQKSLDKLRNMGFADIHEMDLFDAIQMEERLQKVGPREISKLPMLDPREPSSLFKLREVTELRRDFFMIRSKAGYETSDTYKVQQVLDRHLSFMKADKRGALEASFADEADKVQKTIMQIAQGINPRRSVDYTTAAVPDLAELTRGIMTEDEFKQIANLIDMNRNTPIREAALEAAGDTGRPMLEANISGTRKTAAEVQKLYAARAAGLEDMYTDATTGRVSIPALLNTSTGGAAGSPTPLAGQKYKRITEAISDGTIKRLIDKPYVKGSLIGAAALGAFGFIHSSRKDHTEEDITGPPLLPGGSSYEAAYPGNTLNLPAPNYPMASSQNGVTYRVNVSGGNAAARRFGQSAQALIPGASSATYYNNIRDLRMDPYKEMGSSF